MGKTGRTAGRQAQKSAGKALVECRDVQTLQRPGSERTTIQVNEVRFRVIAHTTPMHGNRCTAYPANVETFDTNIDGAAMHVETVVGYARMLCMQPRIGQWRAVTADDIERPVQAQHLFEIVQLIQQFGVDIVNIARPIVSQQKADFIDSIIQITTFLEIGQTQFVARVRILYGQRTVRGQATVVGQKRRFTQRLDYRPPLAGLNDSGFVGAVRRDVTRVLIAMIDIADSRVGDMRLTLSMSRRMFCLNRCP